MPQLAVSNVESISRSRSCASAFDARYRAGRSRAVLSWRSRARRTKRDTDAERGHGCGSNLHAATDAAETWRAGVFIAVAFSRGRQ